MRRWAILASLALGCATARPAPERPTLYVHNEITLDHDQILVCAYDQDENALYCRDPWNVSREMQESEGEKPPEPQGETQGRILEIHP